MIILIVILSKVFTATQQAYQLSARKVDQENKLWQPPSETEIPTDSTGALIRYGRELIASTSKYLGPKGSVIAVSNNMNCQNCHLTAGTQNFANPFSAVSSTYPRYRDRSGKVESVEFRINECLQRSLNGKTLDSLSREMRAMVAYLKWLGKGVAAGVKPKGAGTEALPYLARAANVQKGQRVFAAHCQRCHGPNGEGLLNTDSTGYVYPPLWGKNSYNVSAGLYQLSRLAGFIKNNMPFEVSWQSPQLTNEEAWDVAAYISSQPRPQKFFAYDWPNPAKKPVDYPFGPYADSFSQVQHKYGPFLSMKKNGATNR